MGIFIGIVVICLILYIFNRFDIKNKKFWVFFSIGYFILSCITILGINNLQPELSEELIHRAQNILGGNEVLVDRNIFFILFEVVILKKINDVFILKVINCVVNYFILCVLYRIMTRITEKKYAQIAVVLYSITINVMLNLLVASIYPMFLLATILGMDMLYEKKLLKNKYVRVFISALCFSIANLMLPNMFSFILFFVCILLVRGIRNRENIKKSIVSLIIYIVTFVAVMLLANVVVNNLSNNKFNYFTQNNIILGTKYENGDILEYLSETGVNFSDYNIELIDFTEFIDSYDNAISTFMLIFFVVGAFCIKNEEEKTYLSYLIWVILVWLAGEDNNLLVNIIRPGILIISILGLYKLFEVLKEDNIFSVDGIKNIEKKVLNKFKTVKEKKSFCIILLAICSYVLTRIMLWYSVGYFERPMYEIYLKNKWIMLYNWLPIFYSMLVIYTLTRKVSLSNAFGALVTYIITFANYFKLKFRNDTLLMEDITLIKEAMNMQKNYKITFSPAMITCFIGAILITVILYIFIDKRAFEKSKKKIYKRVVATIILLLLGYSMLDKIYLNKEIYAKMTNTEIEFNIWSSVNQYISRGTMYSFFNSYSTIKKYVPEGYNKKEAEAQLMSYKYSDIPKDKKVNIICIMLEAYNDFSKFDEIEFRVNPYEKLHEIQKESYHGELITSIFAGGTVDTERKFLTGYTDLPSFRKRTNSYVRYFKEQGYTVEGSHPCYEWFYNRVNVNRNIGFDNYYFFENRYADLADNNIAPDDILMKEIINLYDKNKNTGKPYFSFNVTYQNHGPYSSERLSKVEYVKRDGRCASWQYNVMNNYFDGIANTSKNLYNMVQKLKYDDEPVILVFFGDHNPWMGDNNSIYDMLGINFELNEEEGIRNYYATPYIIWGNNKAKDILKNDFVGQGNDISPNFLMNTLFNLAGYEGNEFLKFTNEIFDKVNVINPNCYFVNNKFTLELSEENKKLLEKFNKIQYYQMNEFKNK